jgi:hypothetical protein
MGFDISKIPLIHKAFNEIKKARSICSTAFESIRIQLAEREISMSEFAERHHLGFAPHPNWVGSVERPQPDSAASVGAGEVSQRAR